MAIRLVTVSGPRGAGKETIIEAILRVYPDVHRIVPHTTRLPRPNEIDGVHYHFVNDATFEALVAEKRFLWHTTIGASQKSGTLIDEFTLASAGTIVDITPTGARFMKEQVQNRGGNVMMLGVFADENIRRQRVQQRQTLLSSAQVEQLLRDDPVSSNQADYFDFDALMLNEDGTADSIRRRAVRHVLGFLH